jgi:hypothetical protein
MDSALLAFTLILGGPALYAALHIAFTRRWTGRSTDYPARVVSAVSRGGGVQHECVVDVDVNGKTLRLPMTTNHSTPPGVPEPPRAWFGSASPEDVMPDPDPPEFRVFVRGEKAEMRDCSEQYLDDLVLLAYCAAVSVVAGLVFWW